MYVTPEKNNIVSAQCICLGFLNQVLGDGPLLWRHRISERIQVPFYVTVRPLYAATIFCKCYIVLRATWRCPGRMPHCVLNAYTR